MNLMATRSDLLVPAISDMLKVLIVSFPPNTYIPYIFNLGFVLIQNNVGSSEVAILKLWLFVAQEYNPIQQLDLQLSNLFINNLNWLIEEKGFSNMVEIILIWEEYVLLNIISPNDYAQFLALVEERFRIAN